ncbi:hypothetical protein N9242_03270 [Vicingaceae bacterium]|nr:hypothetical protein [Vicingaceae bacterium]
MPTADIQRIRLLGYRYQPIRQLAGFEKRHRIPEIADKRSNEFVQRLATSELHSDLDRTFASIRKSFEFKRRDISVHGPTEGGGTIATPLFNYGIHVTIDEANASMIRWRREISVIRDANLILTDLLSDVFGDSFSVLELPSDSDYDIAEIIDRFEEINPEKLLVDYDKNLTRCAITFPDCATIVEVKMDAIRFCETGSVSPCQLVTSFLKIRDRLVELHNGEDSLFFEGFMNHVGK